VISSRPGDDDRRASPEQGEAFSMKDFRDVCKRQRLEEENKWAIRDIKHGKTLFFSSWDDMVSFVNSRKVESVSS